MARIRKHVPGFIDVDDVPIVEFETMRDLLEIDFVKTWQACGPRFKRFSLSTTTDPDTLVEKSYHMLMAELNDGRDWYVVGYIDDISALDVLPEWRPVH